MITSIFAVVLAVAGTGVIITGAWGGVILLAERTDSPVPLRYFAIVIGTIRTPPSRKAGPPNNRFSRGPKFHGA